MLKLKKLNNSGFAALEVVAIFAVVMILFNFGLGFFGVIHTGILKSIAARNYAFETYRFKSNLDFFWREGQDSNMISKYRLFGNRSMELRQKINELTKIGLPQQGLFPLYPHLVEQTMTAKI